MTHTNLNDSHAEVVSDLTPFVVLYVPVDINSSPHRTVTSWPTLMEGKRNRCRTMYDTVYVQHTGSIDLDVDSQDRGVCRRIVWRVWRDMARLSPCVFSTSEVMGKGLLAYDQY